MKKLLLDVSCINANFDEAPDHFIVTLTASDIKRIKDLSDKVKELDVYSMEYFDPSGEYCSSMTIDDIVTDKDIDVPDITENMITQANDDASRMELCQIEVYADDFKFKAIPKHCGDADLCRTDRVKISELDNPEIINTISY
jgi:hypothetical protein